MAGTQDKHTWWSITAFNDDIDLVEDKTKFPEWLAKVYGGREKCPKTGTIHFQGALQCKRQVRFGAVKRWLKQTHIQPARQKDALVKYSMKTETSVGEKTVVENDNPYLDFRGFLDRFVDFIDDFHSAEYLAETRSLEKLYEAEYWYCVNRMMLAFEPNDNTNISRVMVVASLPAPRLLWKKTRDSIIAIGRANRKSSALVLQQGASSEMEGNTIVIPDID